MKTEKTTLTSTQKNAIKGLALDYLLEYEQDPHNLPKLFRFIDLLLSAKIIDYDIIKTLHTQIYIDVTTENK